MLVISRKQNQSVVINDRLRVNLSRVNSSGIELSWSGTSMKLLQGEGVEVMSGVTMSLLRAGAHQARISIDAPRHIPVHREEVFHRIMEEREFAS